MKFRKITLVQTSIADYREKFIDSCFDHAEANKINFTILTGPEYFEQSTKTSERIITNKSTTLIKNKFLLGRKILIQAIPFKEIISPDVVICELNPRIINTWLTLLLRKAFGKPTVLWGHAWGRNGPTSKTEPIRKVLRNLSSSLLLYTETQKKQLEKLTNYNGKIFVAPNSLYLESEIKNVYSEDSGSIVYVGRLVSSKKVSFLIEGCKNFLTQNPQCSLEIVGSGDQAALLKKLAHDRGIGNQVVFHGHISNRETLEKIYSRSFVSISPGYVGLSITQSISFGIPMLVSKNENHSPELEALKPGFNGDFFETDSVESLSKKISDFYEKKAYFSKTSDLIANDCKAKYSVEYMVKGFYDSAMQQKP